MAVQHDEWRGLGKSPNKVEPDRSTGNILDKLRTPRDSQKVVTAHDDQQSVGHDDGRKAPTLHPHVLDCASKTESNDEFNDAAERGPAMRPNVVEVPGR